MEEGGVYRRLSWESVVLRRSVSKATHSRSPAKGACNLGGWTSGIAKVEYTYSPLSQQGRFTQTRYVESISLSLSPSLGQQYIGIIEEQKLVVPRERKAYFIGV
jgi:hypothetical protein